jgi:hypothetical protein
VAQMRLWWGGYHDVLANAGVDVRLKHGLVGAVIAEQHVDDDQHHQHHLRDDVGEVRSGGDGIRRQVDLGYHGLHVLPGVTIRLTELDQGIHQIVHSLLVVVCIIHVVCVRVRWCVCGG